MSFRIRAITFLLGGAMALAALGGCGPADRPAADDPTSARSSAAEGSASDEAAELDMPDVVGKNAAVAKDELERLGFTKVTFGSVDPQNDTIGVVNPANWTVKEQSHKAGDGVPADATVVLGCVKN